MSVLWWLIGTVLTVLSFVLLVAGLQGREGVIRIGKVATAQEDETPKVHTRSVNASAVVLGLIGILVGLAAVLVFAI